MGKKKSYQAWTQDQMFLMPPSMKEWLKEDHLAWFILDVVSELDISPVEKAIQRKDARGQRPYDPRMMVALLVYAYCTGVYSSRRMERACQENVAFRVITGNRQPYFTTINEFRRVCQWPSKSAHFWPSKSAHLGSVPAEGAKRLERGPMPGSGRPS